MEIVSKNNIILCFFVFCLGFMQSIYAQYFEKTEDKALNNFCLMLEDGEPNVIKINNIGWSPDGKLLAALFRNQNICKIYSTITGKQLYSLPISNKGFITSIAWAKRDNFLAVGLSTGKINVWHCDQSQPKRIQKFKEELPLPVRIIEWAPNDKYLLTYHSNFVNSNRENNKSLLNLWFVADSNKISLDISYHINHICWAKSGSLIALSVQDKDFLSENDNIMSIDEPTNCQIRIIQIDAVNKKILPVKTYQTDEIIDLFWAYDCRFLIARFINNNVKIYNNFTGKSFDLADTDISRGSPIAITSDDKFLIWSDCDKISGSNLFKTNTIRSLNFNYSNNENLIIDKILSAPHAPFLAITLKDVSRTSDSHKLIIISMHNFYFKYRDLLKSQING